MHIFKSTEHATPEAQHKYCSSHQTLLSLEWTLGCHKNNTFVLNQLQKNGKKFTLNAPAKHNTCGSNPILVRSYVSPDACFFGDINVYCSMDFVIVTFHSRDVFLFLF